MAIPGFARSSSKPALPGLYLSQLLGAEVRDQLGEKIATLKDLVVALDPAEPYDRVKGLVAVIRRRPVYIPVAARRRPRSPRPGLELHHP